MRRCFVVVSVVDDVIGAGVSTTTGAGGAGVSTTIGAGAGVSITTGAGAGVSTKTGAGAGISTTTGAGAVSTVVAGDCVTVACPVEDGELTLTFVFRPVPEPLPAAP